MAVFTWLPDYGSSADREPRIKAVRFGNGYEQRSRDGLNPVPAVWNVTFSGRHYLDEITAIEDFLIARGGVDYFEWTPPRSSIEGRYICRKWGRTPRAGVYDDLTATFEQVFDP